MSRFKEIEGYDKYYITDDGKVYSDKYNERRELSPRKNQRGYLYINLCKNGKYKSTMIHKIVAKHFLENYADDLQVNHIDGNKLNNNVSNLEMVTRSGNMKHAVEHGLLVPKAHEEHWCSKLTEEQVNEIRNKYIPNVVTQEMLAKEYGVSRSAIKFIVNNKTWK